MNNLEAQARELPESLAGAVSEDAIRHLLIRSPLNQAIYKALREYRMGNMCDADDLSCPYPLVDLMSNPAPADISSGEMEMVALADEIETAVQALASRDNTLEEAAKVAKAQAEWERAQIATSKTQRERLCFENAAHACEQVAGKILALSPEPVATITREAIPESDGEVERG